MTKPASTLLRITAAAALVGGLGAPCHPAAAQSAVGVNVGVNPAATGTPQGAGPRRIELGQQVLYNERVATDAAGQTQIAFLDQSTLSIGPNAELTIDQFVYDPNAGAGKLAANVTRGVFRYVGGRISKLEGGVSVRAPSGTIGIRGGVVLLDLRTGGYLAAIFVYGQVMTVTGRNGVVQRVTRPGYEVTIAQPGASPSAPFPASSSQIAAVLALLDGQAGGSGGARLIPSDAIVARQFGNLVPGSGAIGQPPDARLPPIFIGGQVAPVTAVPVPVQAMPTPTPTPTSTPIATPTPTPPPPPRRQPPPPPPPPPPPRR